MISVALKNKLELLSPEQQREIENEIDELLKKKADLELGNRGYGSLKGKIWMSEDFDEPLEDFKDYM